MDNILVELVNGFNSSAVPTLVLILKATIWSVILAIISISILSFITVIVDYSKERSQYFRRLIPHRINSSKDNLEKQNIITRAICYIFVSLITLFFILDFFIALFFTITSLLAVPSSFLIIIISLIIKICS